MVQIKWDEISDADSFPLLPIGQYPVRVVNVEPFDYGEKERWKLTFMVTEGDHVGALTTDTLFFSEKALPRFKLACSRLKIKTDGAAEVLPKHVLARECYLDVGIELWKEKEQNRVSFAGYIEREQWLERGGEDPGPLVNQPNLGGAPIPNNFAGQGGGGGGYVQGSGSGGGIPDDVPF